MRYFGHPKDLLKSVYLRLGDDSRLDIKVDELIFYPLFPEMCVKIDVDQIAHKTKIKVILFNARRKKSFFEHFVSPES